MTADGWGLRTGRERKWRIEGAGEVRSEGVDEIKSGEEREERRPAGLGRSVRCLALSRGPLFPPIDGVKCPLVLVSPSSMYCTCCM